MSKLLFLDTETTGNDPMNDRLFQVCYKVGEKIESEYFKPPSPISVKSQSITHVTNRMVENYPPFSESSMKDQLSKLLSEYILVAHNAVFDIAMLSHEGVKTPNFICTLKVARALDEKSVIPEYNLQFLRYYLELDVTALAHEAKDDVMVLEALFKRLFAKMMEKYKDEQKVCDEMQRISLLPSLFMMFPFGKHRGKRIEDVVLFDREYVEWLLEKKQENGVANEEDWIYTLKYHLKIVE